MVDISSIFGKGGLLPEATKKGGTLDQLTRLGLPVTGVDTERNNADIAQQEARGTTYQVRTAVNRKTIERINGDPNGDFDGDGIRNKDDQNPYVAQNVSKYKHSSNTNGGYNNEIDKEEAKIALTKIGYIQNGKQTPELGDFAADLRKLTRVNVNNVETLATALTAYAEEHHPEMIKDLESKKASAWLAIIEEARKDAGRIAPSVNTPTAASQATAPAPAVAPKEYPADRAIADRLNEMLAGMSEKDKTQYATCLTAALIKNGVAVKVGDNPVDALSGYIKATNPALAETLTKNDGTKDLAADKAAYNKFIEDFQKGCPAPEQAQSQTQSAAPATSKGATITRGDGKTQSVQDFLNEGIENGKKRKIAEAAAVEAYQKSQAAPAPAATTPAPAAPATNTPSDLDLVRTNQILATTVPLGNISFDGAALTAINPATQPAVASTKTADAQPAPAPAPRPEPAPEPTPMDPTRTVIVTNPAADPKVVAKVQDEINGVITGARNAGFGKVIDANFPKIFETLGVNNEKDALKIVAERVAVRPQKEQEQFIKDIKDPLKVFDAIGEITKQPKAPQQAAPSQTAPQTLFGKPLDEKIASVKTDFTVPSTANFTFAPARQNQTEATIGR